jgi:hypothetical protein
MLVDAVNEDEYAIESLCRISDHVSQIIKVQVVILIACTGPQVGLVPSRQDFTAACSIGLDQLT